MSGSSNLLDPVIAEQLLSAAHNAATHAYAPYSSFRVGAALLFDDGYIATGCLVGLALFLIAKSARRTAGR